MELADNIVVLMGVKVGELAELHSVSTFALLDEVGVVIRVILIEKYGLYLDIFGFRFEGILQVIEEFLLEVNIAAVGFLNSEGDFDMVGFEFVVLVVEPSEGRGEFFDFGRGGGDYFGEGSGGGVNFGVLTAHKLTYNKSKWEY